MAKQKEFVFKFFKKIECWDEKELPFGLESLKADLKRRLLKRGYIVKGLQAQKILVAHCIAASAKKGIKFDERKKLQEDIDKMPSPKSYTVMKAKNHHA